jgi:hypothetical protein
MNGTPMMIEITGTAAIHKNFIEWRICMIKVSRPWFFGPFGLRAARSEVILRLFLRLGLRRIAFIDGRWLSSLSANLNAKTQNVNGNAKTAEYEPRLGDLLSRTTSASGSP